MCYSSEYLAKINPRSGQDGFTLSGQSTALTAVNQALCIEKQNIAAKVRQCFPGDAAPITVVCIE